VYQKSNLPGRTSFCAYFLEDLLPARGFQPELPAFETSPITAATRRSRLPARYTILSDSILRVLCISWSSGRILLAR
jgi:hypothetical protein